MVQITALIDGNNFYASCEESIDPTLAGRPLIILSNNDGCIVARNPKARTLGMQMGTPYYKIRQKVKELGIAVRSSNYTLYGDISQRFMNLLENHCNELEIYSIDEAFASVYQRKNNNLYSWARQLRAIVYQNLGITIAIGIGQNKVQAKLANHLAKNIVTSTGIFDLINTNQYESHLENIAIENVWGVGVKMSRWLRLQGVNTAKQLRDMSSHKIQSKYGVVGLRLQNELRGRICLPLTTKEKRKKETCVSRSFKHPINNFEELRQAISSYIVKASEKLRKQNQKAGTITIFARTNLYKPNPYSKSATAHLDIASNDTIDLLAASLVLTEQIFTPHKLIVKAGVIMQNLQDINHSQRHLFFNRSDQENKKREQLIKTIDIINNTYGQGSITWAICGFKQKWSMRQNFLGRSATTRIKEIPIVNA